MTLSPVPMPQFFFWTSLEATLLLVGTLVLLRLSRHHASAATRHSICLSGLLSVLVLPVLTIVMPAWPVSMGTARFLFWASSLSGSAAESHGAAVSWSDIFATVWAAGTVCVIARLTIGWYLLRRTWLSSTPVDVDSWRDVLPYPEKHHPLDMASLSLRSAPVRSALACGVLRPCILLPREAQNWPAFDRRAVLLHELAHISRRDCLANYIAQLACAVFWFHPLAWSVAAQLRREQELACDDFVLERGVPSADYADLMLRSVRNLSSASLLGCAFAPRDLRDRLTHLLDTRRNRKPSTRSAAIYAISLSLALLLVTAVKPGAAARIYASRDTLSVPMSLQKAEPRSTGSAPVYKIGGDISAPVLLEKTEPEYTASAKNKKIQGTVLLSIVVGADGRARDIQVLRSLDPGLDANAKRSVSSWRFKPSERQGKPVDVHANVEVNFRLK